MRAMLIVLGLIAGCTDPVVVQPITNDLAVAADATPHLPCCDDLPTIEPHDPIAEHTEREHLLSAVQRAEEARAQQRRRSASLALWGTPEFRAEMWNVESAPSGELGTRYLRWAWRVDPDAVPDVVRITDDDMEAATVQGLHRITGSENEWVNWRDAVGIWQVTRAINNSTTARECDRQQVPRITECGPEGETFVSSMRRASKYVMGAVPARRARQTWLRVVTVGCDEPADFPAYRTWPGRLRDLCEAGATLARNLVTGADTRTVTPPGYSAVTWGGRCEHEGGACDDPNACRRGLARIPDTGTSNALWCRPGRGRCPDYVVRDGAIYSDVLCAGLQIEPTRLHPAIRRRLLPAPVATELPTPASSGRVAVGQVIPGSPSGPFDR